MQLAKSEHRDHMGLTNRFLESRGSEGGPTQPKTELQCYNKNITSENQGGIPHFKSRAVIQSQKRAGAQTTFRRVYEADSFKINEQVSD